MTDEPQVLEGQPCPFCQKPTLTLTEAEREVPYFGKVYVFSMTCGNGECKYHKADVEAAENRGPVKYTLEVSGEDDLCIRVVKSSNATIKIPHIVTWEPGAIAQGFITNVEGILNRIKRQIESAQEDADEPEAKKKAKNHLKKLQNAMWGHDKIKIIIEDPTGNSAIISEKAVKGK